MKRKSPGGSSGDFFLEMVTFVALFVWNGWSAVGGRRSAVGGRRSAVGGQRSAVSSQQSTACPDEWSEIRINSKTCKQFDNLTI